MTGNEKEAMRELIEKNELLTQRYMEAENFILEFSRYGFFKKIFNFHRFHQFLRNSLQKYGF